MSAQSSKNPKETRYVRESDTSSSPSNTASVFATLHALGSALLEDLASIREDARQNHFVDATFVTVCAIILVHGSRDAGSFSRRGNGERYQPGEGKSEEFHEVFEFF